MSAMLMAKEYFLKMVGASIQGLPIPVCPQEVDAEKVYKLAVRNAVTGILYLAVQNGKISLPAELNEKLQKSYMSIIAREATQQTEIEYIKNEFNKQGINFMFLKGTHLKALYPKPEMRFMVDMDVLVKEEDMLKGKEIILNHGFELEMNNGKDLIFVKKPFLTIELHKMLFVEDYFMHDYFCDVWNRAEKVIDNEHRMANNDLYVYTLAHLCEHYLDAGSCFRPLMDIYLMEKNFSGLNFDYINRQFEELGIEKFAKKIRSLCFCTFENSDHDDDLTVMENYIVFGAPVQNAKGSSKMARNQKSKLEQLVELFFPKLMHMKLKYPILETKPYLLPIYYLIRLFEFAFSNKKRITEKRKEMVNIDQQSVDIMNDIFNKSGL